MFDSAMILQYGKLTHDLVFVGFWLGNKVVICFLEWPYTTALLLCLDCCI